MPRQMQDVAGPFVAESSGTAANQDYGVVQYGSGDQYSEGQSSAAGGGENWYYEAAQMAALEKAKEEADRYRQMGMHADVWVSLYGPDETGTWHPYYLNITTNESQWEPPHVAGASDSGSATLITPEDMAQSLANGGTCDSFLKAGYTEEQALLAAREVSAYSSNAPSAAALQTIEPCAGSEESDRPPTPPEPPSGEDDASSKPH